MHDLVHLYASEQAVPDRDAALQRLVDFYLHTTYQAENLLNPHRQPYEVPEAAAGVVPHPIGTADDALTWLEAEHTMALAAQRIAIDHGWHQRVWGFADVLISYHWQQGHRTEPLAVLRAAEAAGDLAIESRMLRNLAHMCARADLNEEATEYLTRCADLCRRLGDTAGEGHAHLILAWRRR